MLRSVGFSRVRHLGLIGAFFLGSSPRLWADAAPNFNQQGVQEFFIGMIVCVGVFVLLTLGVHLFATIYVFRDCKKRGFNPTAWMIFSILLGLIGLIVYLFMRESLSQQIAAEQADREEPQGPIINNDWNQAEK